MYYLFFLPFLNQLILYWFTLCAVALLASPYIGPWLALSQLSLPVSQFRNGGDFSGRHRGGAKNNSLIPRVRDKIPAGERIQRDTLGMQVAKATGEGRVWGETVIHLEGEGECDAGGGHPLYPLPMPAGTI